MKAQNMSDRQTLMLFVIQNLLLSLQNSKMELLQKKM